MPREFPESFDQALNEKDDLVFLRDEGLEVLALFKKIKDKQKRDLIKQLISVMGDSQDDTA